MATELMNTLERSSLRKCETIIAEGLEKFREVGEALATIRDEQLYREKYSSFNAYCKEKWNFSDSRARQLIGGAKSAAKVAKALPVVTVSNERQARPLAKLPEDQQAAAWEEAVELADGGTPTAKQVEQVVSQRLADDTGEDDDSEEIPEEAAQEAAEKKAPDGSSIGVACPNCGVDWWLDDACANCLEPIPEGEDAEEAGTPEDSDSQPPRKGKEKLADFDDPCPVCAGKKWVKSPDGAICAKCSHPHGEPAGEVDNSHLATQRSKTVKTAESLMRAFDDLQAMLAKPYHDDVIETCKCLLEKARGWK